MLSCKDICENATHHLEGELGMLTRLQFWFHLMICKACRQFLRQFQATIDTARQLNRQAEQEPTDAEIDALVQRLREADPR